MAMFAGAGHDDGCASKRRAIVAMIAEEGHDAGCAASKDECTRSEFTAA